LLAERGERGGGGGPEEKKRACVPEFLPPSKAGKKKEKKKIPGKEKERTGKGGRIPADDGSQPQQMEGKRLFGGGKRKEEKKKKKGNRGEKREKKKKKNASAIGCGWCHRPAVSSQTFTKGEEKRGFGGGGGKFPEAVSDRVRSAFQGEKREAEKGGKNIQRTRSPLSFEFDAEPRGEGGDLRFPPYHSGEIAHRGGGEEKPQKEKGEVHRL